jgi:hypothetical protein
MHQKSGAQGKVAGERPILGSARSQRLGSHAALSQSTVLAAYAGGKGGFIRAGISFSQSDQFRIKRDAVSFALSISFGGPIPVRAGLERASRL